MKIQKFGRRCFASFLDTFPRCGDSEDIGMLEGTFGYIWLVFHGIPVSPLCILEALTEALTEMSTHVAEGDPQRCKPDIYTW